MQLQRIAQIVQADAMGQLGIEQADHVTPRFEGARPLLRAGIPRNSGDLMRRNVVANLAQNVELTSCWFDGFLFFHPCRVAGSKRQANTFFFSILWDGCVLETKLKLLIRVQLRLTLARLRGTCPPHRAFFSAGRAPQYLAERWTH